MQYPFLWHGYPEYRQCPDSSVGAVTHQGLEKFTVTVGVGC